MSYVSVRVRSDNGTSTSQWTDGETSNNSHGSWDTNTSTYSECYKVSGWTGALKGKVNANDGIPAGNSVVGILVKVKSRRASGAKSNGIKVKLTDDLGHAATKAANLPSSATYVVFGSSSDDWGLSNDRTAYDSLKVDITANSSGQWVDVYDVVVYLYYAPTITKKNTALTVPNVSGVQGNSVNLTATLKDSSGNLLSGKSVAFTVNGVSAGSASTNSSGVATKAYSIPGEYAGNYTIATSFAGDTNYNASTKNATLSVSTKVTTITVNDITVGNHSTINLVATLKNSVNVGLSGKTIIIWLILYFCESNSLTFTGFSLLKLSRSDCVISGVCLRSRRAIMASWKTCSRRINFKAFKVRPLLFNHLLNVSLSGNLFLNSIISFST